tara:strand:- start:1626 stop:2015 length:390 start_codon:yes stop_codon:yes gene_type:complete
MRVAIYGTGEAAEVAFLVLRELGLDLEAVFDKEGSQKFLGFSVRSVKEHRKVQYDLLIVARLDESSKVIKRLIALGVDKDKLLPLRASVQSTVSQSKTQRSKRTRMVKASINRRQIQDQRKETIHGKRR